MVLAAHTGCTLQLLGASRQKQVEKEHLLWFLKSPHALFVPGACVVLLFELTGVTFHLLTTCRCCHVAKGAC